MHPVSCVNTYHDITDFVNHGMVKNTKTWISVEKKQLFYKIKKFLTCALDVVVLKVVVL